MEKHLKEYFEKNEWKIDLENSLAIKEYNFNDFISAFSWMTKVAIYAEKLNHHPEWNNVYNKVKVHLQTHDEGKITIKDLELAKIMDNFFEKP